LPINDKAWQNLLNDIDKNNDGMISMSEFLNLLMQAADKDIFNME